MRKHPLPADAGCVGLPRIDDPTGLVHVAALEEQLGVVGGPPADARLAPAELRGPAVGLDKPVGGGGAIAAPERDEPQDRQVLRRVEHELLLRELERSFRMCAGQLEPAAMHGNECDRKVILRHLEAVLDRDVVRVGGVRGRELPAPGPELDPGEAPERAGAPRLVALAPLSLLVLE